MTPTIRAHVRACVQKQIQLYIHLRELEHAVGAHRGDKDDAYDWTNDTIISLSHGELSDVTDEMIDDALTQAIKHSGR